MLFNCIIKLRQKKKLTFYAGEIYSADNGWQGKTTCIPLEDYVREWIKLGARFIGGCCRTNADDIKRIRAKIESLPT